MALPSSPTDGQLATSNGALYVYNAVDNAWVRTPADNLTITGNIVSSGNVVANKVYTTDGLFWSNGTQVSSGTVTGTTTGKAIAMAIVFGG